MTERPEPRAHDLDGFAPAHFRWERAGRVATITLDRPERKNPLTFESYAALRDTFRALAHADDIKCVVITGAGGNFCSGGDVHEIIAPLTEKDMTGLLDFTRMTGDLVKAMRGCPQPILAAVDGVCAGAGAILAMASDLRYGTPLAKVAFLFARVGLAGADMGSAYLLPRLVGLGRATELLMLGDRVDPDRALAVGLATDVLDDDALGDAALGLARRLADGPALAHATTKNLLAREQDMSLGASIELEAYAQALLMGTHDHREFHAAWTEGRAPSWQGR